MRRLIDANALTKAHCEGCAKEIQEMCKTDPVCASMMWVVEAPTVDAVEVADMRAFAEDVAYQFGYYCHNGGRLHITHGGLSTLEWAFNILGWENPHPVPECECEIEGCHEHATCGTPTTDGYKRMCGMHYRNYSAKMDGDGNA